jgi:hypothetical protein
MSVLIEAISVVMRREALDKHYPGGLEGLERNPPNRTFCHDDHIARVGFMTPFDVKTFTGRLEKMSLKFVVDGFAKDFAVVDQLRGLTVPCDWLNVIYFDIDDDRDKRVVAAHLKGEPADPMMAPEGWNPERSLSRSPNFIPTEELSGRMRFLQREGGVDAYKDLETGETRYIGRTTGH